MANHSSSDGNNRTEHLLKTKFARNTHLQNSHSFISTIKK